MKPLAILALGAILGIVGTLALVKPGSPPAGPPPEELHATNERQAAEIKQLRGEVASQNDVIHKLHTAVTETSRLASPPPTPAKPENPLAGLARLMDNPAVKKMMATSQQKVIEDNYADFIDGLKLSPEERAKFVELLGAKQSIDMDFGMQILKATPEDRKKMYEAKKAKEDLAEAGIREFLNSDADFALYQDYIGQLPQRMQLQTMQPAFDRIGQPLAAAQKQALLGIMRDAGKVQPGSTPDAGDPTLSTNDTARMMTQEEDKQKRIAEAAAAVLSPQQLAVLREKQASNLQMMKISMEMGRAMLGDDPDKSTPAP